MEKKTNKMKKNDITSPEAELLKQYQNSAKTFGSDVRQFVSSLSKSDITDGEAEIIEKLSFRFQFVKDLISVLQYSKSMVIAVGNPENKNKGFVRAKIALGIGINHLIYNYCLVDGNDCENDIPSRTAGDCPSCGNVSEILSFCQDTVVFEKNQIVPKKLICSNCLCWWKYTVLAE
jgi:hypothetical protein